MAGHALLFTDLVDSTAVVERLGDARSASVLAEHDRIIRGRLAQHAGVEFKHTGDGLCAWFASASDAPSRPRRWPCCLSSPRSGSRGRRRRS